MNAKAAAGIGQMMIDDFKKSHHNFCERLSYVVDERKESFICPWTYAGLMDRVT